MMKKSALKALFHSNNIEISPFCVDFGETNSIRMVAFGLTSCYKSVKEPDGRYKLATF
jgi:hypothetical protein